MTTTTGAANSAPPVKRTRAEQARINGSKSRGPKTAAGKRISSMNRLKHGRRSRNFSFTTGEDRAAFDALYRELLDYYAPRNPAQAALVARLAAVEWRISRIDAIEVAVLDHEYAIQRAAFDAAKSEADPALTAAMTASHISRNSRLSTFLANRAAQYTRGREAILLAIERQCNFSPSPVSLPQASSNQSLNLGFGPPNRPHSNPDKNRPA